MKKLLCIILSMALLLSLTACGGCDHDWKKAACETPKTCRECGETEGKAAGHKWQDATCQAPKTCEACGKTDGTPLSHQWVDATYDAPKTCSLCGATEGESLTQELADDLVGTWIIYVYLHQAAPELEDFETDAGLPITFTFRTDGTYTQAPYAEEIDQAISQLKADICDYLVKRAYEAAADEGYSQSEADKVFEDQCGMTIRAYAEAEVAQMGLDSITAYNNGGTYTLSGNHLYMDNRDETLTIAIQGSTLQILDCDDDSWKTLFGDYPIELERID